jgi:hypothetical protein
MRLLNKTRLSRVPSKVSQLWNGGCCRLPGCKNKTAPRIDMGGPPGGLNAVCQRFIQEVIQEAMKGDNDNSHCLGF